MVAQIESLVEIKRLLSPAFNLSGNDLMDLATMNYHPIPADFSEAGHHGGHAGQFGRPFGRQLHLHQAHQLGRH